MGPTFLNNEVSFRRNVTYIILLVVMKFLTAFDTKTGDTFSCATLYMNGRNEYIVV